MLSMNSLRALVAFPMPAMRCVVDVEGTEREGLTDLHPSGGRIICSSGKPLDNSCSDEMFARPMIPRCLFGSASSTHSVRRGVPEESPRTEMLDFRSTSARASSYSYRSPPDPTQMESVDYGRTACVHYLRRSLHPGGVVNGGESLHEHTLVAPPSVLGLVVYSIWPAL